MNTLNHTARTQLSAMLRHFDLQAEPPLTNWVNGQLEAGTGQEITLLDPVTGQFLTRYCNLEASRVDVAVHAAKAAHQVWMAYDASTRGRLMWGAALALREHIDALAQLESLIAGKPITDCLAEANKVCDMFEYYAGWCDKQHGDVIPVPGSHLNYVRRVPYGVVGQITPWNAPMFTCGWQLAPALAAGNAVVLKPSELTPFTSVVLAAILERAGLPKGLINIINGDGTETGTALVQHPGIAKLVFVGSPETGRLIATASARRLVPTVLELGGKSANIVFADADLDDAVAGAQAAIFGAAGQSCVAGSRLLVQESILDAVCDRLAKACPTIPTGLPSDPATRMGPLQNAQQYEQVTRMLETALQQGAQLVTGGGAPANLPDEAAQGYFIAPTVLRQITPDMPIAQDEVFGPVLVVMPFQDENDAIQQANASRFGLAAAVWSQDPARAHRVAHQLRAGTVWINSYKAISVMSPFGGFGESGYGRSSGQQGLQEYTQNQSIWVETAEQSTVSMGYGSGG